MYIYIYVCVNIVALILVVECISYANHAYRMCFYCTTLHLHSHMYVQAFRTCKQNEREEHGVT